jgi:hypothetical protein
MHDTPADTAVLAAALAATADAAPTPAEPHGPTPALTYARPDWATHQGELDCPLCEYSLIGLEEPRCPECGYHFQWADLLDPTRRRHPYLYEHHPRRGFRSFWKTAWHALRPRRFWSNLQPSQPSTPRRLLNYWLWVALLSLVALGLVLWFHGMMRGSNGAWTFYTPYTPPPGFRGPRPPLADRFVAWLNTFDWPRLAPYQFLAGLLIGWPVATFATLLIFQASMRRAKVRTVHVLRVVVYTAGLTMWLALALLVGVTIVLNGPFGVRLGDSWLQLASVFVQFALIASFAYHLAVAYRRYLQFDHAAATAIASQLIVALAAFTAFVNLVILY